jgi:hypothetical protein
MDIRSTGKKFVSVTLHRNGKDKDWNLPTTTELNTEVGMVNSIAELASGKQSVATYATVIDDDVGPKVLKVTLTRLNASTLREEVEGDSDELTLDAKGYVTRQVSETSTSDRIALFAP